MAVALGVVTDANASSFTPAMLDDRTRGITCYFCHDVAQVAADHDNGLVLAFDQTMRGGVRDPVATHAHGAAYDPLMDGRTNHSEMCGSCHDVVTQRGFALEQTYREWRTTIFADASDPRHSMTCGGCHMFSRDGVIADAPGASTRSLGFHEHVWPAIDQALTSFPNVDVMTTDIARDLDSATNIVGAKPAGLTYIPGGVCVVPLGGGTISVRVDSISVGHRFPSGAAQDRRAWLEVIAYDASGSVVFASGVVPDGSDPEDISDPQLFGLWNRTFRDDGSPAPFFWDVATARPQLLAAPVTLDPNDPRFDHSSTATFAVGSAIANIDHVTARLRVRAFPLATLDLLVASGDLDPAVKQQVQTLTTGTGGAAFRTWTRAGADPTTGCCPANSAYSC
jgi:hypothetical protein